MPRPREFDEDQVLERALELFWAQGYRKTSPQDLVSAMGLSKSSFYQAFGSKRQLFERCLRRYIKRGLAQLEELFAEQDVMEALETLFRMVGQRPSEQSDCKGCLLCNTATELAAQDSEIQDVVRTGFSQVEEFYCNVIERGQAAGSLRHEQSPQALARYIVSSVSGLQVLAKTGTDAGRLESVSEVILSVFRPAGQPMHHEFSNTENSA